MAVIACLVLEPTESVCAACARLTPVVEPLSDRVFMDWTGCGPVPELARRLNEKLRILLGGDSPGSSSGSPPPYRLGVAPLRFVAEFLAQDGGLTADRSATFAGKPSLRPAAARIRTSVKDSAISEPVLVTGGWYVSPTAMPEFIDAIPVHRLPEVDEKTEQTLASLAVRVLGDLRRIRIGLLRHHVGAVADKLLSWARGIDPRPVAPLYPPERLSRRISGEHLSDVLAAADPERMSTFLEEAAAPLLHRLQQTDQAAAHLAVHRGDIRRLRSFAEPVADSGQVLRALQALLRQLLAESGPSPTEKDAFAEQFFLWHDSTRDDLLIEIVPAPSTARQMTLWDAGRPRNARQRRLQTVLDSLRSRFGDVIGPAAPREAVVRYETMLHLYGAKG